MFSESFNILQEQAGQTLASIVRSRLKGQTWSQIRQLIAARRVKIGGELCLDPARRVREGDVLEILPKSAPKPRRAETVNIRYVDDHLVVVEKPSGISTVRHPTEREWNQRRKALSPTLEDIVPRLIAGLEGTRRKGSLPRLRVVQRLDKETSGLVVFARTVAAERGLGKQFHRHTVMRRYLATVPGRVRSQRIATFLTRDRGDGRRGSTTVASLGKEAITHVEVQETLPGYSLLACRLETGRTHQIRIHLAELGNPVCGEKVYNRKPHGEPIPDASDAPRLALHAAELGFIHPVSGEAMHWTMPLPPDLQSFLDGLRPADDKSSAKESPHANQMDRHRS
jgi:23S rRNA pseudouridine1911/1915/1917 synthase